MSKLYGNPVVVMNKCSYLTKMCDILSDSTDSKLQIQTIKFRFLLNFNGFFDILRPNDMLDNDDDTQLYPSSTSNLGMYDFI